MLWIPPCNSKMRDKSQKNKATTSKRTLIPIIAGIILLLVALVMIAYPFISNAYYEYYFSHEFDRYIEEVEKIEDTTLQDALALAQDYNAALASGRELPIKYEDALNLTGSGLMGYVVIPTLDLKLPIYHDADYTTLETAIGHMPNTALPVGGRGTHCVLTGHSGLSSQRLFSDIDEMVIADKFYVQVLGEEFWYEVDDISVILPYELDSLAAVPGADYCTLVTCTPFGVNTHRLLVRGSRIAPPAENDLTEEAPSQDETQSGHSTWLTNYLTALAISVAVVICLTVIIFIIRHFTSKQKNKKGFKESN